MKKFVINIIIFLLPIVVFVYSEHLYLLLTQKFKNTVAGNEIYISLDKSKQKGKSKKILIGDSVANQLFSNIKFKDTINSLACNQAISMAGHFILLYNYLKADNQIDTVYMIFSPYSFINNLDQVYTYHYFLKPFYVKDYMPLFTETVHHQIHKIPYYFVCGDPVISTSNWAPKFNSRDHINYTFLSPISVEYLLKIKELSSRYKFKIIILPTPTKVSNRPFIEKINMDEIARTGLGNEFKNYLKDIVYINDTNFTDNVHLKDKKVFSEYYKSKLMKW